MNRGYLFITISAVSFIIYFLSLNFPLKHQDRFIPIEYVDKKNKKKEFKIKRKDWINNMHRSHPDDDWELIDKINRAENIKEVLDLRKKIFNNNQFPYDYIEQISRDIEGQWYERGSNNLAGRIRTADIDFVNNTIYCASSGGNIWRGSLDGENWQSLNDYMQILGITFLRIINTDLNQRLLIGSENNGFYYSDNNCLTLTQANGLGNSSVKRFVMQNGTNHIYALVNDSPRAIYRSTDLGENFELILSLNNTAISFFDIFTPRYSEDYIYVFDNLSLYKIENDNLILISNLPISTFSNEVVLTGGFENNGTFLYVYAGGHIFKSINGGLTWSYSGEAPSNWWWINGFNSSNLEKDRIFIGGMEIFRSSNGGDDWNLVNPWWEYYDNIENKLHADIPEVRFFLDEEYNEVALISTDGGLYFSDDYLMTVQNISLSGLGVSQYYSTYSQRFPPYRIFAGSQDQGLQKSITDNNGIQDFIQIISGDYGHLVSGDNGVSVWTNYPGFTIYYPDIANSNYSISLDFPGNGHLWLAPLMADTFNHEIAYLGGGGVNGGNHIIKLEIQGNNMVYEELPQSFSGTISAMAISPLDYSHWYVLTDNGKFYHSPDGGASWSTNWFTGPSSHYFYGATIWPSKVELGKVLIGGSGYSNPPIYISQNHGETFIPMNNGLPNTLVFQLAGTPDEDLFFAATEIGPYVYSTYDEEWLLLSGATAPDQTYWTVDYIPEINTARFGTYGRGIWDFVLNDNYNIAYGDVNNDFIVNIQDIIIVISFILNNNIPNEYEFIVSDINEDGEINILDIVMIIDIIFEG
ncbi:MAG: hypothetical protein CMG66_05160 [Candidatus Marinimicrobia bacterium]|nr:hypothetical protein [Candidatus Neomarinimicrobiota bacterium]|tara:strand:- start:9907 stop:12330 length:2424 start_codon:yes stop_codon:yes gene_type:complete